MQPKETAALKRQLLETKSQSAALQAEVERLTTRVVELESTLIAKTEETKTLQNARQSVQTAFVLEKERLVAESDAKLAEATARIQALQSQEANLKSLNDRAQRTIDALRAQVSDYQVKFTEVLSTQQQLEGVNLQEIFNHEFKERERLNQIILEQTSLINTLQTTKEGLWQENQKFREEFGIPANFAHITLDPGTVNHLTRIEYLEREVEQLEEERAELRCKLRQLAAMVNPKDWEGDVFANLNLEQKELICLYAINLLNGKNEVYLTDKSKELTRENEALRIENEILKRNQDGQQKTLAELAQGLKACGWGAGRGESSETDAKTQGGDGQAEARGEVDEETQKRLEEKEILEKLTENWGQKPPKAKVHWLDQPAGSTSLRDTLHAILEELQGGGVDVQGSGKQGQDPSGPRQTLAASTVSKPLLSDRSAFSTPSQNLTLPEQIVYLIKTLQAKLHEQTRLALYGEKQSEHLRSLIENSALAQSQHFGILKENALSHQNNIKLGFENETFKAKLDYETAKAATLARELDSMQEQSDTRQRETEVQLKNAVKAISHLNSQLAKTVSLEDFQTAQRELVAAKQVNVELTSALDGLTQLKPRHARLITEHSLLIDRLRNSQISEFNLICELQILEEILSQTDQNYLYFKNIVRQMADKLKLESLMSGTAIFERLEKVGVGAISQRQLNQIMDPLGVTVTRADWEVLTTFLLTDKEGSVLKTDLIRRLKLASSDLLADESAIHIQALLRNIIERTKFGAEDLFSLFDSDSDGFVTCDDIMNGLRVLGLVDNGSIREKLTFDSGFFSVSKKLDKEHFVAVLRSWLGKGGLGDATDSEGCPSELGMARVLNDFLQNTPALNGDPNRLFALIDSDKKGVFSSKNFEHFFVEKLKVRIDKFALEKLFSSIQKDGLSQNVTPSNFSVFLKKAADWSVVQANIQEMKSSGVTNAGSKPFRLLKPDRAKTEVAAAARGLLVDSERKTTEFALAQQKMVVCQLGEQIGMLEKENEEKAKLLTLYKQEVGRLSELTELGSKTAEKEEPLGDRLRGRLAPSSQPPSGPASKDSFAEEQVAFHRLQEIQSLKLKLAMAEQEKLDMFKAAAGIAAQHGLNLKEFVSSVEARSREVLLLNTVREKSEEIQLLVHKVDHFQAKWVEEKLLCQSIVEALCEKLGLLQAQTARQEASKLLVFDINRLEQLSHQNRDLTTRLTESESEKSGLVRQMNKAELDLELLRVEFQYFVRRAELSWTEGYRDDENGLIKRFQMLLEESKSHQMEKIKAEKQLKLEITEGELGRLRIQQKTDVIAGMEVELEKLANQNQQREVFWSQNYQKLLTINAKINSELKDFGDRRAAAESAMAAAEDRGQADRKGMPTKMGVDYAHSPNELLGVDVSPVKQASQEGGVGHNTVLNGVTAGQLRELLDKAAEPHHSKDLLIGAQTTLTLLENMLAERQEEIASLHTQIENLKVENAKLREQLIDQTLALKENVENKSNKSIIPLKSDQKLTADQKSALLKPLENQRQIEKLLRLEVEGLKRNETNLAAEIQELKSINSELMVKIKENLEKEAKYAAEKEEKLRLEKLVENLEKRVYVLEEKIQKKDGEIASLLDTVRVLKNDLVGQTQSVRTPKPIVIDSDRLREEAEGKLKVTQKRLKEVTSKLKDTAEELGACRAALAKKEQELSQTQTDMTKTRKKQIN